MPVPAADAPAAPKAAATARPSPIVKSLNVPPAPAKETRRAQDTAAKRGPVTPAIIGSLAAVMLVAVALFLLWPRQKSPEPLPASAFASASPAQGKQGNLGQALDGVIAAAQKTSRPQGEIAALTGAKTKILALVAQKTPQASDQVNQAARDMGKAEITALGRSARRMWRDLGAAPDAQSVPDPTNAIAALKTVKADLDPKLAVDLATLDAAAATGATQQALDAYAAFQGAYAAAAPLYVAARKKDIANLLATAQSTTDQIVALAAASKPWFLASQARKQAYQLRQDNAAHAKALLTQLSSGASTAQSSKDMRLIAGALTQLTEGQATLSSLYAASNAATL